MSLKKEEILLYPLITEKAVGMIEKENKISFIVNKAATKKEVKNAVEKIHEVSVEKVHVVNDLKGRKRAIVKLGKEFKAEDLATKLGVI